MKHFCHSSLFAIVVLLFFSSPVIAGEGTTHTGDIKVYKAKENDWKEIKNAACEGKHSVALHLDYDSYYTIQVNENETLKQISATVGETDKKQFKLPFKEVSVNANNGMEDYFTDLPFAIVSYKMNMNNVYTVLVKTKTKEMIGYK